MARGSRVKRLKRFTVALRPINYKLRYSSVELPSFPAKEKLFRSFVARVEGRVWSGRREKSENPKQRERKEKRLTQLSNFGILFLFPLLSH